MNDAISPPLKLGGLHALLGFHLRLASATVARDFTSAMASLDLTQKQFAVLELISANAGVAQVDIAQSLGSDRATMMALIDRLEARGLVCRQRSARDGRRQELLLTVGGREILEEARQRIAAHESRFARLLDPAQSSALLLALRRISGLLTED